MLSLITTVPELNIFFHELPSVGDFSPNFSVVKWNFKPVISSDKSKIEDIIIEIKNIQLNYIFKEGGLGGESSQEVEETLEISPGSDWTIEYEITRNLEDSLLSDPEDFFSIQSISFYFTTKKIEVSYLN